MLELVLIILEKLENNIWLATLLLIIAIIYKILIKKRGDYLFRTAYVDKNIYETFKTQTRGMILMCLPVIMLVVFIYHYSVFLYQDSEFNPVLYVTYYIPLLLLIVVQRVRRVVKRLKISWLEGSAILIPGMTYHILYLLLILNARRSIWIIALVILGGAIIPSISQYALMYVFSDKDIKKIKLKLNNGKIYYSRYEDIINEGCSDFVSIRVRNKTGSIKRIIKFRKEDVIEQEIYLEKPKQKD